MRCAQPVPVMTVARHQSELNQQSARRFLRTQGDLLSGETFAECVEQADMFPSNKRKCGDRTPNKLEGVGILVGMSGDGPG